MTYIFRYLLVTKAFRILTTERFSRAISVNKVLAYGYTRVITVENLQKPIMGAVLDVFSKCCKPSEKEETFSILHANDNERGEAVAVDCTTNDVLTTQYESFATTDDTKQDVHSVSAVSDAQDLHHDLVSTEHDVESNDDCEAALRCIFDSEPKVGSKRALTPTSDVPEKCPKLIQEANILQHVSEENGNVSDKSLRGKKKGKRRRKGNLPENDDSEATKEKKQSPNYFVAFKVSNPEIRCIMDLVQQHIARQDKRLKNCMISLDKLHMTLMVMHIADAEEHARALEVLQKIHSEYNKSMCENPLELEFRGLSHFNNAVLFVDIPPSDALNRLKSFAEDVNRHFENASIYSTDKKKGFNPHLTLMKLSKDKKLRFMGLRKISPSLYTQYADQLFGTQVVHDIELLSMYNPRDKNGYYSGTKLQFDMDVSA